MNQDICKVCGKPMAAHHLVMRWGVVHAAIYDASGRSDSCSERAAEHNIICGRLEELRTVVRSLRWHAGRLNTLSREWYPDDLSEYADKFERDINRLIRVTQDYYAWARKK